MLTKSAVGARGARGREGVDGEGKEMAAERYASRKEHEQCVVVRKRRATMVNASSDATARASQSGMRRGRKHSPIAGYTRP